MQNLEILSCMPLFRHFKFPSLDLDSSQTQVCLKYDILYNNQINARTLIGQSALVYCASKPGEKSRVFWIIIQKQ